MAFTFAPYDRSNWVSPGSSMGVRAAMQSGGSSIRLGQLGSCPTFQEFGEYFHIGCFTCSGETGLEHL